MLFTQLGYGAVFLIVLGEAMPFFGTLFPGQSTIVTASFAAKVGILHPVLIIVTAGIAIVIGETFSFLLGKKYGVTLLKKISAKHESGKRSVEKIHRLIDSHAGKALFVGRCVPLTRSLTPFAAGAFGVSWRTYFLYGPIGAILWVVGSVGLGYIFGEVYERLSRVFDAASALIVIVLVGVIASRVWRYTTGEFSFTKKESFQDDSEVPLQTNHLANRQK